MAANGDSSGERRWRSGRRDAAARLRLGAWALLAAALACAAPLARADDALDISTALGFADTFQPGRWTPLVVTVSNQGRDLTGELEVQVVGGNELRARPFLTVHRRKLELARGAAKSLQFTVYPQSLFHPIVIRVLADGREVARSELDLRTRSLADERLLVVLSRDANLDYLSERDGARAVYPHPELLPAHWRGYHAVGAMLVHGVSLERLSALQFDALRKWIAQGGILAVSGRAEYTLLRTPRLAALLPALPSGTARVDPAALRAALAAPLELSQPVHVHRLGASRGETRLEAGDLALVVERAFGRGRVLYFTFDVAAPPFDRWSGMRALWMQHLRLPAAAERPAAAADPTGSGLVTAMLHAEPADFPSYGVVLLFLAAYAGLLLAGHQLSARGRLRALAPLWSWAAPALVALVAWLLFGPSAYPRGASAITVAVIEPIGASGYARLDLDLAMYANRSDALRMEYRGAEPAFYPRQAQRASRVTDWVLGEGPRPYLEPQDRRRYVLHALRGEDLIDFDLQASLRQDAAGLRVRIDNGSGRSLDEVRLLFDGHVYALGAVAAGARGERPLARAPAAAGAATWRDLLVTPRGMPAHALEPVAMVLERKLKADGADLAPAAGQALLVGYTASPLRPAESSAHWPRRERALVALRVAAPAGQDR